MDYLKEIKNVKNLNDEKEKKLSECVIDESIKKRVRYEELDVLKSDEWRIKENYMEVIKNKKLDREMRIKELIEIVECKWKKYENEMKEVIE